MIVPRQDCCGLPLQSNGLFDDARRYVRKLARNLAPYARRGYDIVATSTSCGLMLKREAREILELEDDEDLRTVSAHMYDICEFLLKLHERGELRTDFRPLDMTVPYHAPCQQQGHGIGKPALELFALIPGLEVVESDVECCGVAGTYGLKTEKYDIAMEVGAPLFRQVAEVATEWPPATARPAAGRSPRPRGCPPSTRSSSCTAPTGWREGRRAGLGR